MSLVRKNVKRNRAGNEIPERQKTWKFELNQDLHKMVSASVEGGTRTPRGEIVMPRATPEEPTEISE